MRQNDEGRDDEKERERKSVRKIMEERGRKERTNGEITEGGK